MTHAIVDMPGVISESVDLRKDDVVVRFDRRKTSADAIRVAIEKAGFHPHRAP